MKKISIVVMQLLFTALPLLAQSSFQFGRQRVAWDSLSLTLNGKRVLPVLGEIHFTRVPANEWRRELHKMKEGGVTIASTYIFWNHIEPVEGMSNWTGDRDLRQFIEICKDENLAVILRIGPFCNGEVKNGGLPDWLKDKGCKMRTQDSVFMHYTQKFYAQIARQTQGLMWKEGGPVIAIQLDNEYTGDASYLVALKHLAQEVGLDAPFYTRTNWHSLKSPVPFGEMIPMYSDYPDGFWEPGIEEGSGNYYQAYNFRPATGPRHEDSSHDGYPYFTCEQGGGMMCSYARRMFIEPMDIYSISLVKLGSGCNLIGYYMYHGGTNFDNPHQRSYDYQAPIGEFGQLNPVYYELRPLHLFLRDFGGELAGMQPHYPQAGKPQTRGEDTYLRWSYRTNGQSAYVFVNNHERFGHLSGKYGVRFTVLGLTFPSHGITIPADAGCIFPVNVTLGNAHIEYATAQLVAQCGHQYYLQKIDGVEAEISTNGKMMAHVQPSYMPIYKKGSTEIFLIDKYRAQHLFLDRESQIYVTPVLYTKVKEAGPLREIKTGGWLGAQAPSDADFLNAARYIIDLPEKKQGALLDIDYVGDVARLYAQGQLINDNLYNGRHFQYDLSRLPASCRQLELHILPVQKSAPILFPRQAAIDFGGTSSMECVKAINILHP